MKKSTLFVALLLTFIFFNCTTTDENINQEEAKDPNFRVFQSNLDDNSFRASLEDPCFETNLIAGQNHIAGKISVDINGTDLLITYTTDPGWSIEETHLSIGNCDDQWVPTTGSGNPKVGRFEHSTSHNTDVNLVTYILDSSVLNNEYCFATHAVVNGPTGGETAWSDGFDFDGNSWAMYSRAYLSDCDVDGDPVDPTK